MSSHTLGPDARRMLDGPVFSTLVRLAAPTVALMLLQGVVSAGEAAFVGRLGPDALAGAALSFPFVMLMTTLSAGAYGGGLSSAVARSLGAGRPDDAAGIAGTGYTLAAVLGGLFSLAMLLAGRSLYFALGARDGALNAATLYSNTLFLGATPFWIFGAASSVLRGSGNAVFPALVSAIGGLATLAVSPLLIFGWGPFPAFGIAGAGGAIVAYNVSMALVLGWAAASGRGGVRPRLADLIPRKRWIYEIVRVAGPSTLSTLVTNATFIILTALVAPFGAAAVAGYGAGGRLEYLLIPVVFGIGSALTPLVAASDGAGDARRVQSLTRTGAGLAALVCGLAGTAVALFPHAWTTLFTDDPAVIALGAAYSVRVGPAYVFLGLGLALYFAAQGKRRVVPPLLAGLTRLAIAGLGGWAAIHFGGSLDALFLLMAAGLTLYGLVMVAVMRRELGLVAPAK